MKEVTKQAFRELFLKHGSSAQGWGIDYWNKLFEPAGSTPMRFMVTDPESTLHNRMMIASDYKQNEHRMFFVTIDQEEQLFNSHLQAFS